MNVSRIKLQISFLSNSPLLSIPNTYGEINEEIKKSCFSKSFFPFFYSSATKLKFHIKSTTFKHTLNSAIHTEELMIAKQTFKTKSITEFDSVLYFRDCKFIQCSGSNEGGAINSQMSLFVINCLFNGCQAEIGGSIYSLGRTSIDSTTIGDSVGYKEGGAIFSRCPVFSLQFSSAYYVRSLGPTIKVCAKSTYNFANITISTVMEKKGSLMQDYDTTQIRNSFFSGLYSGNCCGGIFLWGTKGVTISDTLFIKIKAAGADENFGWAITAHSIVSDVDIYSCYFDEISGDRGGPFGNVEPLSGLIIFHSCCFNNQTSNFLKLQLKFSVDSPIITDQCRKQKMVILTKYNGYNDPSPTKKSLGEWLLSNIKHKKINQLMIMMFTLGGIFGAGVSLLLHLLKKKAALRKKKRIRKQPITL